MSKSFVFLLLILRFQSYQSVKFHLNVERAEILEVIDGDSLMVKMKGKDVEIRLKNIDAPEWGQKSGQTAKIGLKNLINFQQSLIIVWQRKGYYGRHLAQVYQGGRSLNLELVRLGLAFIYPFSRFQSVREKKRYLKAYTFAQTNRIGIWESKELISPWKYRKRQKLSSL